MRNLLILPLLLICSLGHAQDTPYNYYLGPWQWEEDLGGGWIFPEGTAASIDLRYGDSLDDAGLGFFAVNGTLPEPYILLGQGKVAEIEATESIKTAWENATGYSPSGDTLADVLFDYFTAGSDVSGLTSVRPILPNQNSELVMRLNNHSVIKSEKFVYGTHPHTDKVRLAYQEKYRRFRASVLSGVSNLNTHRKYLDTLGLEFRMRNPENEFIPKDLPKETRQPHGTTLNETWEGCADSDNPDCDQDWVEVSGDLDIDTNQGRTPGGGGEATFYVNTDFSNDDHEGSVEVLSAVGTVLTGVMLAYDVTANDGYGMGALVNNNDFRLYKIDNGVRTTLASDATCTMTTNTFYTVTGSHDGGSLAATHSLAGCDDLSTTDTSVTTGTKAGIRGFQNGTSRYENWSANDIVVAGGWTGKVSGVSNPAKVNGVSNANIASVSGG